MPDTRVQPATGYFARGSFHFVHNTVLWLAWLVIGAAPFTLLDLPSLDRDAPWWLWTTVTLPLLALFGLSIGAGLEYLRARPRSAARTLWQSDHLWDPAGVWDDNPRRARTSIGRALLASLFAVPLTWSGVHFSNVLSPVERWGVLSAASACDALVVYLFYRAATSQPVRHLMKYGRSELRFESFPFFLGQPLRASLRSGKPIDPSARVTMTLRHVKERFEHDGSEGFDWVGEQVYADRKTLDGSGLAADLAVAFDLPQADYETHLNQRDARFWELIVEADTPGPRLPRQLPRACVQKPQWARGRHALTLPRGHG